ncbi:MAG: SDR family oxidoreductase [Planctomycetaceae bacterium]|jgi:thioester reductase-like protein|nr:SDR family oxidoreductase [Planctomycetaceae bacterium]
MIDNKYIFITGATGLLGAYLLKDLLLAGRACAVVVRSNRFENGVQRIESILARFESDNGVVLPRPVVLEGDLSKPMFGFNESEIRWVKEHCNTILHNAASLLFQLDEKTNEPYRSNVNGTANVLNFCQETGIRQFHHVSTAYVCGLRTDTCFESELDVGQNFGNDYEKSKVASEKLVRAATFINSLTVYRPSIIIGDSKNGYSSTFHGYYTPLKIVHSFVDTDAIDGEPLLAILGLTGTERKHFVPVDWVSAALVHILSNPQKHGKTYHLTPKNPTTCKTTLHVFEKALQIYFNKNKHRNIRNDKSTASAQTNLNSNSNSSSDEIGISMLGDIFRDQMEVYQAYWRDDPLFDRTNTESALADLPCPDVTPETLLRLAFFALDNGFGWPRPQPIKPDNWVQDFLYKKTTNTNNTNPNEHLAQQKITTIEPIGLQVNGRGGGAWTVIYDTKNKKLEYQNGLPTENKTIIYINSNTFNRIISKKFAFNDALNTGAIHIENSTENGINLCRNFLRMITDGCDQ